MYGTVFIVLVLMNLGSVVTLPDIEELYWRADKSNASFPCRNLLSCSPFPNSPCTHFYPTYFFDDTSGAGHSLQNLTRHYNNKNGTPDSHVRFVHTFSHEYGRKIDRNSRFVSQLYLHIHKNGGTTVKSMLQIFAKSMHRNFTTEVFYFAQEKSLGKTGLQKRMVEILQYAPKRTDSQFEKYNAEVMVFSFIRDPLSRFVSSTSQFVLSTSQASQNEKLKCGGNPPKNDMLAKLDFFRCVLYNLSKTGAITDQHFTPQVIELYNNVGGVDARVSLLEMNAISTYAGPDCLGVDGYKTKTRFYNKDQIFADLNPFEQFDEGMMQIFCRLYEIDIIFLRSIGKDINYCDPFV